VGLKLTISAGERPQTHAFDRAATGTGSWAFGLLIFFFWGVKCTFNSYRRVWEQVQGSQYSD